MNTKLFCVVLLLCLAFSKCKSFMPGPPESRAQHVVLKDKNNLYSWYISVIDTYTLHPDTYCKRHILSEKKDRPSILRLEIFDNLPVNCSWVIDAGLGERVYVNSLAYAFEPNERFTNYSKKSSPYDDALNMSIYDGDQVNESKRLFKLGDEKLENVISTGSNLTISVNFKKSDIYDNQVIGMRISYSYDHKP